LKTSLVLTRVKKGQSYDQNVPKDSRTSSASGVNSKSRKSTLMKIDSSKEKYTKDKFLYEARL
jgi:hypothetical protein